MVQRHERYDYYYYYYADYDYDGGGGGGGGGDDDDVKNIEWTRESLKLIWQEL